MSRREPAIDFQTAHDAGLQGLDDVVVLDKTAREGRQTLKGNPDGWPSADASVPVALGQ